MEMQRAYSTGVGIATGWLLGFYLISYHHRYDNEVSGKKPLRILPDGHNAFGACKSGGWCL